ncbi:hypothetical protein, partial [Streptomyces clavifer]|uniref:hypothetical protein n=1 Tax=Streptomyces clavifer TaxID=68188 RepID=UPI003665206A
MSSIPAGEGEAGQTALRPFPVTEVTPDEVGMVSVRYVEGTPQLVITGGTVIPAVLTAVDGSGDVVAEYTAPRRLARSSSYSILEAGIGMAGGGEQPRVWVGRSTPPPGAEGGGRWGRGG